MHDETALLLLFQMNQFIFFYSRVIDDMDSENYMLIDGSLW